MKTNALEYLKHLHCQFRLSEHILSSAYPVIAQIMEEYAELVLKQANGAEQSDSNCNISPVIKSLCEFGLNPDNCIRKADTCFKCLPKH